MGNFTFYLDGITADQFHDWMRKYMNGHYGIFPLPNGPWSIASGVYWDYPITSHMRFDAYKRREIAPETEELTPTNIGGFDVQPLGNRLKVIMSYEDDLELVTFFLAVFGEILRDFPETKDAISAEIERVVRLHCLSAPSITPIGDKVSLEKPKEPPPPKAGAKLNDWFDWYHAMNNAGYKCGLKEIAGRAGYSHGTVKQQHGNYKKARGLN